MFDKDISIKGKHATFMRKLKDEKIFNRIIDVYLIAPLIGYSYDKKAFEDKSSHDSIKIFAEVILKEQDKLFDVFNLICLCEDSFNLSNDEKIKKFLEIEMMKKTKNL